MEIRQKLAINGGIGGLGVAPHTLSALARSAFAGLPVVMDWWAMRDGWIGGGSDYTRELGAGPGQWIDEVVQQDLRMSVSRRPGTGYGIYRPASAVRFLSPVVRAIVRLHDGGDEDPFDITERARQLLATLRIDAGGEFWLAVSPERVDLVEALFEQRSKRIYRVDPSQGKPPIRIGIDLSDMSLLSSDHWPSGGIDFLLDFLILDTSAMSTDLPWQARELVIHDAARDPFSFQEIAHAAINASVSAFIPGNMMVARKDDIFSIKERAHEEFTVYES